MTLPLHNGTSVGEGADCRAPLSRGALKVRAYLDTGHFPLLKGPSVGAGSVATLQGANSQLRGCNSQLREVQFTAQGVKFTAQGGPIHISWGRGQLTSQGRQRTVPSACSKGANYSPGAGPVGGIRTPCTSRRYQNPPHQSA
eukprot:625483-Prorocentrum_minimum.AAC.2